MWPSAAAGEGEKKKEEEEENIDSSLEELKSSDDESYERMINNSYQIPSKSTSRTSTLNSFLHQESPSDFQTSHTTDSRQQQHPSSHPSSPCAAESFIKRNTGTNFIKPRDGKIPVHESFDSPVRKQRRHNSYSLLTVPILESPTSIPARCSPQAWPGSPYLSPVRNNRSRSTLHMSNQFESSTPIKSHIIHSDDEEDVSEGEAFHKPMLIKRNLLDVSFQPSIPSGLGVRLVVIFYLTYSLFPSRLMTERATRRKNTTAYEAYNSEMIKLYDQSIKAVSDRNKRSVRLLLTDN
eukprot:sb/3467532/